MNLLKDQNLKDLCTLKLIEVLGVNFFIFFKVIARFPSKCDVPKLICFLQKQGILSKEKKEPVLK